MTVRSAPSPDTHPYAVAIELLLGDNVELKEGTDAASIALDGGLVLSVRPGHTRASEALRNEANASRGVDDRGAVLTSAATISTMKQYLVDHDVQITWEGLSLPAVAATMDWSFTEVAALRRHPNI